MRELRDCIWSWVFEKEREIEDDNESHLSMNFCFLINVLCKKVMVRDGRVIFEGWSDGTIAIAHPN
jgi:hypothetical protein